jgi:conjugal transfer pilus assembly protein TraU
MNTLVKTIRRLCLASAILLGAAQAADAACSTRFINPITDICWNCMFPISIGSVRMGGGGTADTPNPVIPVCICPGLPPPTGLSVGVWEPARLADVASEAGCFVNMGVEMNLGLFASGASTYRQGGAQTEGSFWHAHYYYFPVVALMGQIVDGACMSGGGFDVAYMSEFDPLWYDADLNMLIQPEAVLFASPLGNLACAADCVAASVDLPLDPLFWCAGCQGSIFPIAGDVQAHDGGIQAANLIASRVVYRMHRLGLASQTASTTLPHCVNYPGFMVQKSAYRFQLTRPNAVVGASQGALPYGRTTRIMEIGREYPVKGESFGWLAWRKQNCCASP